MESARVLRTASSARDKPIASRWICTADRVVKVFLTLEDTVDRSEGHAPAGVGETPTERLLRACGGPVGIERTDLAKQSGVTEPLLARLLGPLLDEGQLLEVEDRLVLQRPRDEADVDQHQTDRPRRDPGHEELRDAEWQRLARLDPNAAPDQGWGMSAKVTRRAGSWGASPPRLTIEVDLDVDADQIARKIRELQEEHGVKKLPKLEDARRRAELLPFAEEHGTGVAAFERWNRDHPDMRYGGRRAYRAAAAKAIKSRGSVADEVWRFAGRPEVEEVAPGQYRIAPAPLPLLPLEEQAALRKKHEEDRRRHAERFDWTPAEKDRYAKTGEGGASDLLPAP